LDFDWPFVLWQHRRAAVIGDFLIDAERVLAETPPPPLSARREPPARSRAPNCMRNLPQLRLPPAIAQVKKNSKT